jgi:hypothetical protein
MSRVRRLMICTFTCLIAYILFITYSLAETVHDKVRPSLVFLKATAQGSSGPAAGVEQASLATGVMVSENGLVLTVYHFLTKLGDFEPTTLQMRASISKREESPALRVSLIDANPTLDLLLLKVHADQQRTPKIAFGSALSHPDSKQIYSSGFLEGQGYITGEGKIAAREGPVGYVYATGINFGHGQSGSPVYDDDAKLIGIAKGSLTKKDATNYFIPIEFAERLLFGIRIPEITQFMAKFPLDLDPSALNKSVKDLESGIKVLRERMVWRADINKETQKVTLSYEKLLSGDPHPNQIILKVTPYTEKQPLPTWEEAAYPITTPNPTDAGAFDLEGVFTKLSQLNNTYPLARVSFAIVPMLPDRRSLKTEIITREYR